MNVCCCMSSRSLPVHSLCNGIRLGIDFLAYSIIHLVCSPPLLPLLSPIFLLSSPLLFLPSSHPLSLSPSFPPSHSPSLPLSVSLHTAPTFNKRRQNTVEKQIENLQKDEATLRQMLEMSSTIHRPHQVSEREEVCVFVCVCVCVHV